MSDSSIPTHDEAFKIVLIGIENAGKSSILMTLTHQFDEISKLKPTVSVERTFLEILGKQVVVWDFGGQEAFRDKYMLTPERFFDSISHIFYVLDIQDPEMLGSNIMYFQGVYKRIKNFSPKANFVILFHKLDPELKLDTVAKEYQNRFLDAVLPKEEKLPWYYTSIYNPYSIVKAFTENLFGKQNITDNVSRILESFCIRYHLYFASLVTEDFLEIGFHVEKSFLDQKGTFFESIFKEFYMNFKKWLDPRTPIISRTLSDGLTSIIGHLFVIQTKTLKIPFYLVVGFDNLAKLLPLDALKKEVAKLDENLGKIFTHLDLTEVFTQAIRRT
jgi:small GTP-binding protein